MSQYTARIVWHKSDAESFLDNKYSRAHHWYFSGGVCVPASSSVHIVPLPYSVEENVDPEEAFVASLSSCHMLVFLAIAAKQGYVVERYEDNPIGVLSLDEHNNLSMTEVTLKVAIKFSALQPSAEQLVSLHHLSHQQCFIANSVKTKVTTQIV